MRLTVNNKEGLFLSTTLSQLIAELSITTTGIAVSVNRKIIPRQLWEQTNLNEGDSIIIIKAVYGG
ncbi:MAG: sulfur carrier protein ThiS [Alistipes sp.]|nr:sulfur carrier protein ThiS [Alistipes sp.]MBQ7311920.1 sulfur carrier protein ThiS [Alistipes sp.]